MVAVGAVRMNGALGLLALVLSFLAVSCTDEPAPTSVVPLEPPGGQLRYDPFGPDQDCGDFATHEEAQAFYVAAGGPDRDRHRLDRDRDGFACEWLP